MKINKSILYFLLVTFGISWGLWFPILIFNIDSQLKILLRDLGNFGPFFGFLIINLTFYQKSILDLIKDFYLQIKRISIVQLLISILIPTICIFIFSLSINKGILELPDYGLIVWILIAMYGFLSGPFSEEFGWRGFLLPKLIESNLKFISYNLILGFIWIIWHIPLVFMDFTAQSKVNFIIFSIGVMILNFFLNWIYIKSSKNILLPIFGHFAFNMSILIFQVIKIV